MRTISEATQASMYATDTKALPWTSTVSAAAQSTASARTRSHETPIRGPSASRHARTAVTLAQSACRA
jgi:hypothetical protein